MDFLTSRAAIKINCIALISMLNFFDDEVLKKYFLAILKNIIPEVENYQMSKQSDGLQYFIGKVENSPSLRFATNILSERKDEIRKQGLFDNIDLKQYFLSEFQNLLNKLGINLEAAVSSFKQGDWGHRLYTICKGWFFPLLHEWFVLWLLSNNLSIKFP